MIILSILAFLVFAVFALHYGRTLMVEHQPEQKIFAAGRLPDPLPNGLLRGSVPGTEGTPGGWLGKTFKAADGTGINLIKNGDKTEEKFPFTTYAGTGLRDDMQVYKIDYNLPGNPWWLRPVMDEIVEVAPGQYLGKLHVRLLGIPFTLAFFRLEGAGRATL